jgi:hypothetical protein
MYTARTMITELAAHVQEEQFFVTLQKNARQHLLQKRVHTRALT